MTIRNEKKFLLSLGNQEQEIGSKNLLLGNSGDGAPATPKKKKKIGSTEATPIVAKIDLTASAETTIVATPPLDGYKFVEPTEEPVAEETGLLDDLNKRIKGTVRGDKGTTVEQLDIEDKKADASVADAASKFTKEGESVTDIQKREADSKFTKTGESATDVQKFDVEQKTKQTQIQTTGAYTTKELETSAQAFSSIVQSGLGLFQKQAEPALGALSTLVKELDDKTVDRSAALEKRDLFSYLEGIKAAPKVFSETDYSSLKAELGIGKADFLISQVDYTTIDVEGRLVYDRKGKSQGYGKDNEQDRKEFYYIPQKVKAAKLAKFGLSAQESEQSNRVHNVEDQAVKLSVTKIGNETVYFYSDKNGNNIEVPHEDVYAKTAMKTSVNIPNGEFEEKEVIENGGIDSKTGKALPDKVTKVKVSKTEPLKSMFVKVEDADEILYRGMPPEQQSMSDILFSQHKNMEERRTKAGLFEGALQGFPKLASLFKLLLSVFPKIAEKIKGFFNKGGTEEQVDSAPTNLQRINNPNNQQPTVQLSPEATQLRDSLQGDLIIDTTEKTKLSAIFTSEQQVLKALENLQAVAEQNGQPLDKNKVAAIATTISSSLGIVVSGGTTVPSGTTVAPTDLNSDPNKDLITTLVRH